MPKLNRFTESLWNLDTVHVFDDFTKGVVTAHQWTTLVADTTPTVTTPDAVNGLVRLFTDTTDNNEVAIRTTAELFKFGIDRQIYFRCKIQYAENDTNKANVFVGFCSALGANTLVDNGAGPRVTGDMCGFFKVDGGTTWKVITQTNGTAQTGTTTTTAGGATPQVLEVVLLDGPLSTGQEVAFLIDGVPVKDSAGNVITHTAVIASATEMHFGIYVKSGGGAGGETLDCDYAYAAQLRV